MNVKLIECPRDAMQGLTDFIPTQTKVDYINSLLKVGYDTIDFGSFVSPKAIPQLADTAAVLEQLDYQKSTSKLLAIVANYKGAENAMLWKQIDYIGFPFSISETFQKRNTKSTITDAFETVIQIQNLCMQQGKKLVVYISMGFGNPYGDPWNVNVVEEWVSKMNEINITTISLSDTIGIAKPDSINYLFSNLIPKYSHMEIGAHFHTTPETWYEKVDSAFKSGCTRFDGAIKGFGGCPMAADKLTGNMPTENLISYFEALKIETNVNKSNFMDSLTLAQKIFTMYH